MQERDRALGPSARTGQSTSFFNNPVFVPGLRAGCGALLCALLVACGTSPKEPARASSSPRAPRADATTTAPADTQARAQTTKPAAKKKTSKQASARKGSSGATRSASAGKSSASQAPKVAASPSPGAAAGTYLWPASGQVTGRFNGGTNKGIDIRGNPGDPVVAAASGRVVYVGSKLRGYGNLVMVKHNDEFMTAYAHNSKILVRENEQVKAGQKIAEMGSTDSATTRLHFEVRRRGNAVDPLPYLKGPPPEP